MGSDSVTIQPQTSSGHTVHTKPVYTLQPWYDAYMAALFESDRPKIAERIKYAEQLILNRSRELRTGQPEITERRALDNALHALHALAKCLNV